MILVSNDDGYQARGVHHLTKLLQKFGRVVAVCPETPQSGKSMAITVNEPLRFRKIDIYKDSEPGVEWYAVNGTPTDCVKMAMHAILGGERPELVCTGINHGSNHAVNVLYSGTMGAAFEGCAFNIPAIGFSLDDHSADADFTHMLPLIEKIVEKIRKEGLPDGICLNVNAPKGPLKGLRLTRACRGYWDDEYTPWTDPHGNTFYWLTGTFINEEPQNPDTDDALMKAGYMTIVPETFDRTAPSSLLPPSLLSWP